MNNMEQRAKERSRLLIRTALRLIACAYLVWLSCTQFIAVYLAEPEGKSLMYVIVPVIFIGAAIAYAIFAFRFYSREIRRQVAMEEEEEARARALAEPAGEEAPDTVSEQAEDTAPEQAGAEQAEAQDE